MQVDSLVLGRIKSIGKFHLDICLPNGELGKVSISDISDNYTNILKKIVESGKLDTQTASLNELFSVGDIVRCFIKEHGTSGKTQPVDNGKKSIELSLNPKLVNKGVIRKFLRVRTHFVGAVESEEDHGYIMDSGIPGVQCFLPRESSQGTKHLVGSMLPHLLPNEFANQSLHTACNLGNVGKQLKAAIIQRVDKRTIHLSVSNSKAAVAVVRKMHIPQKFTCDNLKTKFTVGQKINCRIIDHDLLENVAICTMKKKLLQLPYLSIEELNPGDKLEATVNRFTKTGIVARVEDRLSGLIPYLHLADVSIKHPAEHFQRGEKVACRVLILDRATNKLILTAKPGLVESTCPLFGSEEMLSKVAEGDCSLLFTAYVVKVNERGILVAGLNDLRGWLPKTETGLAKDDVLEATYFRGQVLRVRIMRDLLANTETVSDGDDSARKSRFRISLKLKGTSESINRMTKPKSLGAPIGQVFHAKVIKSQNTGLMVELHTIEKTGSPVTTAFLGFDQLSDSEANSALFIDHMAGLKVGSRLDLDQSDRPVVVLNRSTNTLLVSARPMLVYAAQKKVTPNEQTVLDNVDANTGFLHEFAELRVGSQWFAWVINHMDYGIFVQFPSGVRGLAPTRLLTDTRIPKHVPTADLFPLGATVIAKVVETGPSEKRRCLVSLRLMDTYFAEEHYVDLAIQSLRAWLAEREWIGFRHSSLAGYHIGDLVDFHVESIDGTTIQGKVTRRSSKKSDSFIPATAFMINTEGSNPQPGSISPSLVSFVDHVTGSVELVLSSWILNAVRTRKENAASKLVCGQVIKSVTLAVRPRDVAVVAFRGHAAGRLGLVPARRSCNDVTGGNAWTVGQRNEVTVRGSYEQMGTGVPVHLCTLHIYDPVVNNAKNATSNSTTIEPVAVQLASLRPGHCLPKLHFSSLVDSLVFFHLPESDKLTVFCRLVNLAHTAKAVRAFQLTPPEVGKVMDREAVVLRSAAQDQRRSAGSRGVLQSRTAEVTFLGKDSVMMGELVCGQLIRMHQDFWSLHLPGGAHGCLHITGMQHNKKPQPIPTTATNRAANFVRHHKDLGIGLKANQLITCRIIDQVENQFLTPSGDQKRVPLFFVSTRSEVIRGTVECWQKRMESCGTQIDAFVKVRAQNGLLVSLTHSDEMLIPFNEEMQQYIRKYQLPFRFGDHLCVRFLKIINNQMVGELIFEDSTATDTTAEMPPSLTAQSLEQATEQLLETITTKVQKKRKYQKILSDTSKSTNDLKIFNELGNEEEGSSTAKKMKTNDEKETDEQTMDVDDTLHKPIRSTTKWNLIDPQALERYAAFMLPEQTEALPEVEEQPEKVVVKRAPRPMKVDASTAEWTLREKESRNAMLAALTIETQSLPKGQLRPTSVEEFELAVRNAPSSAACWMAYITHILSDSTTSSLTEARVLGERGLRAIRSAAGLEPGEQDLQQARLLVFQLIMEAKQLERCTQRRTEHVIDGPDPVLEADDQANRLSDVLARLVNLDQTPFTRKAIETLAGIGQFDRAEELARKLIKASPKDADRWLSLINVRFRAGRVAPAREAQRNAVSILRTAQLPQFLVGIARLELEFGDADRALSLLREQLAAHPKQRQIYEELIKLLLIAGKENEAKSVREKATDIFKPRDCEILDELFNTESV